MGEKDKPLLQIVAGVCVVGWEMIGWVIAYQLFHLFDESIAVGME